MAKPSDIYFGGNHILENFLIFDFHYSHIPNEGVLTNYFTRILQKNLQLYKFTTLM